MAFTSHAKGFGGGAATRNLAARTTNQKKYLSESTRRAMACKDASPLSLVIRSRSGARGLSSGKAPT